MPLDWTSYDAFAWGAAKQAPIDAEERRAIEQFAADVAGLANSDCSRLWGAASPPGRYAATVIHLLPGIPHKYQEAAASQGIDEVAVKIFKCTNDAQREARKLIPFHLSELARLPGIPNPHVQRSLRAGNMVDIAGAQRSYIVQQWAPGASLERRAIGLVPRDRFSPQLWALLHQLFLAIIIPLWHEGTIWWDIRDANFVFCDRRSFLMMIDADSLAAYSREILYSPTRWEAREKGRRTALARLRQMTMRLIVAQGQGIKANIEAEVRTMWNAILEPNFQLLGRRPEQDGICRSSFASFIERLEERGLLGAN
jgi:hypothetical protein